MSDEVSSQPGQQEALQRFADTRRQQSEETEIIEPAAMHLQRSAIYITTLLLVIGLVGICIGKLDVIVTARGIVEPRTKLVPVESGNTGVVRDVAVAVGDHVTKGQLLLRLKTEVSDIDIASLERQLDLAVLDHDRKSAEANVLETVTQDFSVLDRDNYDLAQGSASVALLQNVQTASFEDKTASRRAASELDQIRNQAEARIDAINKTIEIRKQNLAMAQAALEGLDQSQTMRRQQLSAVHDLMVKGITTKSHELDVSEHVLALEEGSTVQREKIGDLSLAIANDDLKVTELTIEKDTETRKRLDALHAAERALAGAKAAVFARLAELTTSISTLDADIEKRRGDLQLKHGQASNLEVRAPVAGTIASLAVTSPGVHVAEGFEVAKLVPEGVSNVLTSTLQSKDVGQIKVGQRAILKFDAYPFYRFGTIPAHVSTIVPLPNAKLFGVSLELDKPDIRIGETDERIAAGLEAVAEIMAERRRIIAILLDRGLQAFSSDPLKKDIETEPTQPPASAKEAAK